MPAPATSDDFLGLLRQTDVVDPDVLDAYLDQLRAAGPLPAEPKTLAALLVRDGVLTHFQAGLFLLGRTTGFTVGKYRILERLGIGGMGSVFLCEDRALRRRVAVKVLPPRIAKDPAALARFHREAQVVGVLDHANIVHALDFCQDDNLYYLVMEFIDGVSLQEIVDKTGPMDPARAAHYVRQTAEGLQHAHEAGLVHRDIKPGNILVDRGGTVKILDLGLARFTDSRNEAITTRFDDQSIMGTADYLAPEQAVSLSDVDIRADIYSLGMTFYFLLAGRPPFKDGTVAQKLVSHQMHEPTPIRELRPEVSEELAAVLAKMTAKEPARRYQTPGEAAQALAPFTQTAVAPPAEAEMRRLSPAALGLGPTTGQLASGPATMRGSGSWVLPEGASGNQGTRTQTIRPVIRNADTPNPSALPTADLALKPIEDDTPRRSENNGRKSDKNYRPAGTIQECPPAPPAKKPADEDEDEDVELVEEEPADASPSSRTRRSDKGRRRASGPSSTKLPGRKKRRKEKGERAGMDWRLWAGLGAGIAVMLLGIAGFLFFLKGNRPAPPDDSEGGLQGQRGPTTLVVGIAGGPHTYPTIRAAYDSSIPGDTILVSADVEEAVSLHGDGGKGKDVILKADSIAGKPVVWKAPPNLPDGQPLLELKGVSGLRVKGFRFDGEQKVDDLIVVTGRCPGTVLDDLHCVKFRRCAVRFSQCSGADGQPVLLHDSRVVGEPSNEAAVVLDAGPDQLNQHIRIENCRFEGVPGAKGKPGSPCKAGVQLTGPAADIAIRRNRFFVLTDGVLWRKADPPPRLHLSVEHNTFANLTRGLRLEVPLPNDKQNGLAVKDNLFLNTNWLAFTDGVPPQPTKPSGQLVWHDEGQAATASVPAGNYYFRRVFDVPGDLTGATLNISADESFSVWVNGQVVGPSPPSHYVKRVYAFNLAKQLKAGKNVLAVQAVNTDDFFAGGGSPAALLVQLTFNTGETKASPVVSDRRWTSTRTAASGWQEVGFNDGDWTPVKVLGAYNVRPWNNLMWDSFVNRALQKQAAPLAPIVSGNCRDLNSGEGYPLLDARGGAVKLPMNPSNNAQFLRYNKNSPLVKVGSPGVPP
jgi:serine/threonine protein kinase